MIKPITIFSLILLLGTTCVMSQSNITVQDKKDSSTVINDQQQTGQSDQISAVKSDSTTAGTANVNNTNNQPAAEKKYFLEVPAQREIRELQLQQKNDSLKIQ